MSGRSARVVRVPGETLLAVLGMLAWYAAFVLVFDSRDQVRLSELSASWWSPSDVLEDLRSVGPFFARAGLLVAFPALLLRGVARSAWARGVALSLSAVVLSAAWQVLLGEGFVTALPFTLGGVAFAALVSRAVGRRACS